MGSNFKVKKLAFLLLTGVLFSATFFTTGCRKDNGNGNISFSTDTLTFDTVFATFGSTTRYFKVFNDSRQPLKIDDIRLMHLVGQQFRMMVDGVAGDQFSSIEIPAKDSIYVFVEVTVNPNDQTNPYVIIDDVMFTVGDKTETVHLQAWGQNAHFHYGLEIDSNSTVIWNNDLPHVIVSKGDVPGVYIRCGSSLKINPGCKVFFEGNSAIFVEGTLTAEANTWTDSIVFQGARLEQYYDDKPGQWFGVVFLRNNDCIPQGSFDHCIINESSYGIYAGSGLSSDINTYLGPTKRPVVNIKNSIIKNGLYNTVFGFNAKVTAENSLFYVAGEHLVKLGLGGEYNFAHCTMYNSGSKYVNHQKETLLLSNGLDDGNGNIYIEPLVTSFKNCIVYGNLKNEVAFANANGTGTAQMANTFEYCLLKTPADTLGLFTSSNLQNLFNQEPLFRDATAGNFTPYDSVGYFSPAIDNAISIGLAKDLFDNPRPVSKSSNANKFDIGAVEVQ